MTIPELLASLVVSGALFFSLGYGCRWIQESQKNDRAKRANQPTKL